MAKKISPNSLKNLVPFEKGVCPNPKGRPKKFITAILEEMHGENGEHKVSRAEVYDLLLAMAFMETSELEALEKSKESPTIVKITAKALKGKNAYFVLRDTLDRLFGKPTTTQVIAGDAERPLAPVPIVINSVLSGLPPAHNHIEDGSDE